MLKESFVENSFDNSLEQGKEYKRLVSLWGRYKFIGKPPKEGSPAHLRLVDTCRKYINLVVNPPFSSIVKKANTGRASSADILGASYRERIESTLGDSEDYFAAQRRVESGKPIVSDSDANQRELHNQIALMVLGTQRSGMEHKRAEEITFFASELVYDMPLSEVVQVYSKKSAA